MRLLADFEERHALPHQRIAKDNAGLRGFEPALIGMADARAWAERNAVVLSGAPVQQWHAIQTARHAAGLPLFRLAGSWGFGA